MNGTGVVWRGRPVPASVWRAGLAALAGRVFCRQKAAQRAALPVGEARVLKEQSMNPEPSRPKQRRAPASPACGQGWELGFRGPWGPPVPSCLPGRGAVQPPGRGWHQSWDYEHCEEAQLAPASITPGPSG